MRAFVPIIQGLCSRKLGAMLLVSQSPFLLALITFNPCLGVHRSALICITCTILQQLHPGLALGILLLELPFANQGVDLAVSKHLDLLICECALHSIWVEAEVLVCGQVILLDR